MYKKKITLLVIIALILTGCTRIDSNVDNIINATMSKEISDVNTVSTGYELYIPVGVRQLIDNEYNQKLKIKDTHVYLYVDTVSYFYKNSLNYESIEEYNYYYKEFELNKNSGYLGINKLEDESYFVKIVYNYSKMEFYVEEEDMPLVLSNSLVIIKSIKYNDSLIKIAMDQMVSDSGEIKYELDKPEDSESTFSQFLQEYVDKEEEEVVLPDEE